MTTADASRNPILIANDLRKTYGARQALRGLSFTLQSGRVLGFLGPNGAGKTTSIRILTTIIRPDSGSFFVNGVSDENPGKIRQAIGVLPESLGFPKQITGIEFLMYYGQLYGLSHATAKKNAYALIEEVGMLARVRSPIGSYSRGMRQRLGIARALVNNPSVLFLDEPTLGLDPRGQQELLDLIQRIARERSVGIVLCSHQLTEIEVVCDDVLILSLGQVVAHGPVGEILGKADQNADARLALNIHIPAEFAKKAREALETSPHVQSIEHTDNDPGKLRVIRKEADVNGQDGASPINNQILEVLIRANIPIKRYSAEGGRLLDVFFQLTEETIQ